MRQPLPSLSEAKAMARAWRSEQAQAGETHSHSAALEHVAQQLGFRDWNACVATLAQSEARSYATGDHVSGHYLSQPFTARILRAIPAEGRPGWVQVELELDHPVDVVTSERFSNLRRRIRAVVGPEGYSREKTSDGVPHLVLEVYGGHTGHKQNAKLGTETQGRRSIRSGGLSPTKQAASTDHLMCRRRRRRHVRSHR